MKLRPIGKKGDVKTYLGLGALAIVLIIFAGFVFGAISLKSLGIGSGDLLGDGVTGLGPVDTSNCPDDKDTSLKINAYNHYNETATENFDVQGYLYQIKDGKEVYKTSISDTTSPSATTIDCGYEYVLKLVSADADEGNNSKVVAVTSGPGEVIDGNVHFKAESSNVDISIKAGQHGVLECRAYDNIAKGLMYDSGDSSNTDWETDGATFTSTTNNATATTEANGIDITFDCRATLPDTNANDFELCINLDDFDTNIWQTPSVKVDGTKLSPATLDANEKLGLTAYDYVYCVAQDVFDAPDGIELRVATNLLSGASASADLEIDINARTQRLALDGVTVYRSSADDTTSHTTTFAMQDFNVDIT